jgi:hypothetical protein
MCRVVHVTNITGPSPDDWIYWHFRLQPLLITLKYSATTDLHTLQTTVAHALGFFIYTSRLLATDLNTHLVPMTRFLLLSDSCAFVHVGRTL